MSNRTPAAALTIVNGNLAIVVLRLEATPGVARRRYMALAS